MLEWPVPYGLGQRPGCRSVLAAHVASKNERLSASLVKPQALEKLITARGITGTRPFAAPFSHFQVPIGRRSLDNQILVTTARPRILGQL